MNENVILNLGGSGGGASLNFKVVGNPQPASPKENTIWLNTDVPIGAWYFIATQPENLNEGDVCFSTGTSSPVAFNALKKNSIQVYPLSAKQYVGGTLVDIEAKSYQGGEWADWIIPDVLFRDGNENAGFTGGWEYVPGYKGTATSGTPVGIKSITASGYLRCERSDVTSATGIIMFRTKNKIGLTNYNTLTFKNFTAFTANSYCAVGICVDTEYVDNFPAKWRSGNPCDVKGQTITVDISSLSGNYYAAILVGYWGGSSAAAYVETNEIILGK